MGALLWFPILVHLTDMVDFDWIFDYYLTSCLPILGIQWWFRSIYATTDALYSSLDHPLSWPDPSPLLFDHEGNEKPMAILSNGDTNPPAASAPVVINTDGQTATL